VEDGAAVVLRRAVHSGVGHRGGHDGVEAERGGNFDCAGLSGALRAGEIDVGIALESHEEIRPHAPQGDEVVVKRLGIIEVLGEQGADTFIEGDGVNGGLAADEQVNAVCRFRRR